MSSNTTNMGSIKMRQVHPKFFFGDDWVKYAADIQKAKTPEELLDVFYELYKQHKINIGDIAFIFAKVFFSEEVYLDMLAERDAMLCYCLFERLHNSDEK